MWLIIAVTVIILFALFAIKILKWPSPRTIIHFNKLPGPTDLPFYVGLLWKILWIKPDEIIPLFKKMSDDHDGISGFYGLGVPTILLTKAEYIEPILKSHVNIDKGPDYQLLTNWLGEGLLISTGEKWRHRRKLLTPSFHFKILEDNTECMNRNFKKVAEKLLQSKGAPVELLPILGQGALDIICETAMGTALDKEDEGEEYVAAAKRVAKSTLNRFLSVLQRNDMIFEMTSYGKETMRDIKTVHNFTEKVIRERKTVYDEKKRMEANEYSDSDSKTPKVFIDSLLDCQEKENLTVQDIREEVDTFMFAGHDTTSAALQFALLQLGAHPDVQEKAYQEQVDIFGYSDRDAMKDDLAKMHYLEQIIKETLRLNPSAPQIARELTEDVKLSNGALIPAGCKALINIFLLHRDPKHFPEPEKFDPDRFSPEASTNRHPYSFLPFSAGPRNCIGQKFAMMEMKVALSTILRSCRINAVTKYEDIRYEMVIVLKPTTPVRIEVLPRYSN